MKNIFIGRNFSKIVAGTGVQGCFRLVFTAELLLHDELSHGVGNVHIAFNHTSRCIGNANRISRSLNLDWLFFCIFVDAESPAKMKKEPCAIISFGGGKDEKQ